MADFWYSNGTKGSDPAPPRRTSFAFGRFIITTVIKRALTSSLALLWGAPSACLAPLRHVCSQLKEAALQLLWSWTPGWIQTTCTILAYVWHSTGKEGPADAPPGTASFGFGEFVVTIVRRAKSCPSSIPPSPSGTVEHLTEPLILRLHEIRMALTAVVISTRAVCLKPSLLAVRQLR